MGSVSGSLIPVVPKMNSTFRKRDIRITQQNSDNDSVGIRVDNPVVRTISSGSIVRDNNTVEYTQDLAYGITMMGRTNIVDRTPSAGIDGSRDSHVELGDNQTDAVIPTSLTPDIPQYAHRNTGRQIVQGLSTTDTVIERVANTGIFGV